MPQIKVQHDLGKADKPPARTPLPPGQYDALIANSTVGLTQSGLAKFTVEFRIVKTVEGDATFGGRRVYQDYIVERGPEPEMAAREAFRIRQLLDATAIAYTTGDAGFDFNTDHLHNKAVRISVTQRPGKKPNADGVVPIFNNVERVDTAQALNEADVI